MTLNRRGRTICIVQARTRSTRLPRKVLREVAPGMLAIDLVLDRVKRATRLDALWLACSSLPDDDDLAARAAGRGYQVFRGDEDDVLSRFVHIARETDAAAIVRITGDCPFADPAVIDRVVAGFHDSDADFVSNTLVRSWPDGLDVEVFTRAALDRADAEATLPFLRLHVTPYIHGRLKDRLPWGGFSTHQVVGETDFSHLRWTLDEADDLEFIRRMLPKLPPDFGCLDVVACLTRHPEILRINRSHTLHEGTRRDLEQPGQPRRYDASNAFYDRAAKVIPLATQTFSKSSQQWVRGAAPLFADSAKGCRFTDLDGNTYIDYVLGLLPIVLGYRDPDVDAAIEAQLERGITFSMPHPLEAEVAERLVRLIPCAEMVRFGKNGSDATTAAIRLARAHTGRDKVAIASSGYHGWHDWYIGTTTRDLGVPEAVKALSVGFDLNDPDRLESLLADDGVAAVIIEPTGAHPPAPGVLERVRALTEKHGTLLVFDETITGFRTDLHGAQGRFGVTPDLATFGKAMANGMPVSAIVGRAEVMRLMEQIFFSATFGGEALSLAAAAATMDKLERENGVPRIAATGAELMARLNAAFDDTGFGGLLRFGGEGWWPRLAVTKPPVEPLLLNSLLRQEFNAQGLFLGAGLNLCLAHCDSTVLDETGQRARAALAVVRGALDSADPEKHLRGKRLQPVFSVR